MSDKKIVLTKAHLKALARYELDFADLAPGADSFDIIEDIFTLQETYQYTLRDLYAALGNLIEKDPSGEEFAENWFYPIRQLGEDFGIDAIYEKGDVSYYDQAEPGLVRGLPVTEESMFARIWDALEDFWSEAEDDDAPAGTLLENDYLGDIDWYYENCGKSLSQWQFSQWQKTCFIEEFDSDDRLDHATQAELALCRQFTDELCEMGQEEALRMKGYACYGGNRLYDCDWKASRDCMLALLEKTDDPMYANTLGYIYYYGRCTGGKPEYDKAREMFSFGAANGYYESIYKLADMYAHGYGCRKSAKAARSMYGMVYDQCYESFLNGKNSPFADAAIRMGNVYLKGIGEEKDPGRAYGYYLQAELAHRMRTARGSFYGDTTVAANIRKALDETKTQLENDFFTDSLNSPQPWLLYSLLQENNRVAVSIEKFDKYSVLRAVRVPVRAGQRVRPILLTMARLELCLLTAEIEFTLIDATYYLPSKKDGPVVIDWAEWNDEEQQVELFFDNERIGWICCSSYVVKAPKKEAPSGRKLRLISIRFQSGGRTYDYLCDDETVREGDTVVVPGYNGDTFVTVERVFEQYESELGLPSDRYKKAVKAEEPLPF
ncbi:MAG: sel1 repeat family protein [Firmicutes bacterium]|nr:sel1 repeat family protein [Bacillota bacterium]